VFASWEQIQGSEDHRNVRDFDQPRRVGVRQTEPDSILRIGRLEDDGRVGWYVVVVGNNEQVAEHDDDEVRDLKTFSITFFSLKLVDLNHSLKKFMLKRAF